MRTSVNAVLSFGLVNVPVGVASATTEKESIKFRTLHSKCETPISMKQTCVTCHADLQEGETVKGFEFTKGEFITFDEDELAKIAPERNKVVTLTKFVPGDVIGSHWLQKDYVLIPNKVAPSSYGVLLAALTSKNAWGVGIASLWGKEHPVVVRPTSAALIMTTLFTFDQISPIDFVPPTATEAETALAEKLVEASMGEILEEDFVCPSDRKLRDLVEAKIQGKEFEGVIPERVLAPTLNVLDALVASLKDANTRKPDRKKVEA